MASEPQLHEPVQFFIEHIREQPLDGGNLRREELIERHNQFDVWRVSYRSHDLRISGLMGVPHSGNPFPTVIINHGFFPPENYHSGKGTIYELRALAERGYLTVSPDFRNYGDSDQGDNTFQPGFLHDVRNLIPALEELPEANTDCLAMMGHSMGAGLSLQTLVTTDRVSCAALLGAVTGREAERFEARRTRWSHGSGAAARGLSEFSEQYGTPNTAPESFERMSVINYLDSVSAPIIMHHGEDDEICPINWANEIYEKLQSHGKNVAIYRYKDTGHVFREHSFNVMVDRTDTFFKRNWLSRRRSNT